MPAIEKEAEGGQRPKILFCSYHCYLDPSSGAALSVRDLFTLLCPQGWQCQVFCGSCLDFEQARPLTQLLRDQDIPFVARPGSAGTQRWLLLHFQLGAVPVMVYQTPHPNTTPGREEGVAFLGLLERVLEWFQPDLVLTYGGHWLAKATIASVKSRGIPVVFWLCNLAYREADLFQAVDGVLVPSRFVQGYYRQALGLNATAIPCPLDWSWCHCPDIQGQYVTFVNPQPEKGVFWFAALARELGRKRPDIPLLVVEGRGTAAALKQTGLDLSVLPNLRVMANTPDPRAFYRVSRVVLMPSLWHEPFGRVAAEASINGIPVLASRRGGLPEVLAEAGFLLDIPACYTPESRELPTADETAVWVQTIIRLWDDAAFYQAERQRCLAAAEAWRPERLAAQYDTFLKTILNAATNALAVSASPAGPQPAADLPEISVIMPVYNGSAYLERALRSVCQQTFERWELLVVDDGSTDDSYQILCQFSTLDARIRPFRLDENCGSGPARNCALRQARGGTIAYLDCDDEYYADYLANVAARQSQADVLVFAYDLVEERGGRPDVGQVSTHYPSRVRTRLMEHNIVTPLGVAHRRALLEKTGLFSDAVYEVDWDMWKRFARARALFLFLECKSGLYHIRADSQARTRRIPDAARKN